ncbi:MAG: HAD-IIIA family hydrolase [Nitrospirota bacterium]
MKKVPKKELSKLARQIKLLILDVDGVLTDGGIILDSKDNELKIFHVRDGHGIRMLLKAGVRVALVTGRHSEVVKRRAEELGLTDVYQNCRDKLIAYSDLATKYSLAGGEIAYVGDDVIDIPLLRQCGLAVAVADADEEVKAVVSLITKAGGGRGAVREVCDLLLKAKDLWKSMMDEYLKA